MREIAFCWRLLQSTPGEIVAWVTLLWGLSHLNRNDAVVFVGLALVVYVLLRPVVNGAALAWRLRPGAPVSAVTACTFVAATWGGTLVVGAVPLCFVARPELAPALGVLPFAGAAWTLAMGVWASRQVSLDRATGVTGVVAAAALGSLLQGSLWSWLTVGSFPAQVLLIVAPLLVGLVAGYGALRGLSAPARDGRPRVREYAGPWLALFLAAVYLLMLVPQFFRGRSDGELPACRDQLRNISTALEMYAEDHGGRYPATASELTPRYLQAIPTCASTGQVTYVFALEPQRYTVVCHGGDHRPYGARVDDYPRITGPRP